MYEDDNSFWDKIRAAAEFVSDIADAYADAPREKPLDQDILDKIPDEGHFCPNCGAILEDQEGFDPDGDCWQCQECGAELSSPEHDDDSSLYEDAHREKPLDQDILDKIPDEGHYCPNCGAILEDQAGFDPDEGYWQCEKCGTELLSPEYDSASGLYEGVIWHCDNCDSVLNIQPGFSDFGKIWECTMCGFPNHIDENHIGSGPDLAEVEEFRRQQKKATSQTNRDYAYSDEATSNYTKTSDNDEPTYWGASDESESQSPKYEFNEDDLTQQYWRVEQDNQVQEEKKSDKGGFIALIIMLVILLLSGLGLYLYDKERIPYASDDVYGIDVDKAVARIREAGFTNIEKIESNTSWLESGKVIRISFDGEAKYRKGKYINRDAKVTVFYSSGDRINVSDILEGWQDLTPKEIAEKLRRVGLENVSTEGVDTSKLKENNKVANLTISGKSYNKGKCFIPKDASIIISYYVYTIAIGKSSLELIGQDYAGVASFLQSEGFSSVKMEEKIQGWEKGNCIIEISISGVTDFERDTCFKPDAEITILYSSNDRMDITEAMASWKDKSIDEMKNDLGKAGLSNYIFREKNTDDLSIQDYSLAGVVLNYEPYVQGECYIPKNAPIAFDYYRVKNRIGDRYKYYTADKKMRYKEVVAELRKLGFTDITLYRNNALVTGWLDSEGSVASIYIDGKEGFSKEDTFYRDAKIEIIVNTFKNDSCEEIKDYRKK